MHARRAKRRAIDELQNAGLTAVGLDLKAVIDAAVAESDPLQGAERGPDYQLDVATSAAVGGLLTARINADALEDIFVFTAMTPDSIEGILLLSN